MYEYKTTTGEIYTNYRTGLPDVCDPDSPGDDWVMVGSCCDGTTIFWFWQRSK